MVVLRGLQSIITVQQAASIATPLQHGHYGKPNASQQTQQKAKHKRESVESE